MKSLVSISEGTKMAPIRLREWMIRIFVAIIKSKGFFSRSGLHTYPASTLDNSIAGRYRPVRVADGPITPRYRFIKNA